MRLPGLRSATGDRQNHRTHTIGTYFAAFVVLFAIAAGAGAWFSRHEAERFAIDQARDDAVFAADQAAGAIDDAFTVIEAQLVKTAVSPAVPAVIANPSNCTLTFAGVDLFGTGHLDFIAADGSVKCSSQPAARSSNQYTDVDWQRDALTRPLLTGPLVDAVTGKLVVISSAPVPSGGGFVAAVLDLDMLASSLSKHFAGRLGLEFVATTGDGAQILSRSLDPQRWVGATTGFTPFTATDAATRSDVDGNTRIYGNATATRVGWHVYAGAARDRAIAGSAAPYHRSLVIVVLSLLAMTAVAAIVYRRIVGPIRSLSRSVRAQAGDPSRERIAVEGPTEVVTVADEFNTLLRQFQDELAERRRAEQSALESEQTYRVLFEDNPQPMWVWDRETFAFLAVNDAAVEHYGYSRDEFLAMHLTDIVPPEDGSAASDELQELRVVQTSGEPLRHSGPWRHVTKTGDEIEVEITSHSFSFHGRDSRFAMAADVTQRLAYETQLRHLALHDELTGLANRTLFLDRLAVALTHAQRHPATVGVLFLDLDRFKLVNDVHGHDAGDELLIQLASRLQDSLRPGDTVARLGGDEFVVLCADLSGETEAISVAARIEGLLSSPFELRAAELFITASMGITLSAGDDTPEDLLRNADAATNRAKERGGNRYEIFDDALRQRTQHKLETGNDLRHAIERNELRVYYQPEIDLQSGACVAAEALVRWQHPTRGLVEPNNFIPLAEENGYIVPLGAWVLRTACRQAAIWRRDGTGPRVVSVNLAARELSEPGLVSRVSEALDQAGLDPAALVLEITETCLVEDPVAAAAVLASLRDLGVQLSIDDFGTGYSSLLYLRQYAVDILKIDRSFVAGLGKNRQDDAIIASVIDLAHTFGLTVVAEGVETTLQADSLRLMRCDIGQGYLWSRPVPPDLLPAGLRYIEIESAEASRGS